MKYFWSKISSILVLNETLHFDKYESADFKYDNSFLKLQPESNVGPKFKNSSFARNLAF